MFDKIFDVLIRFNELVLTSDNFRTMKIHLQKIAVMVVCLAGSISSLQAQAVYNQGIVGYYNHTFNTGNNLFAISLMTSSNLSGIFYGASAPPDGATVSLWNSASSTFDQTSTYTNGSWSVDLLITPGIGAMLFAPSSFTTTITGIVLSRNGSMLTNVLGLVPPPPFSGPNGIYLLSDIAPVTDTGTDIFLNILGRLPNVGEQVTQLNGTSTYLGNGNWDSVPTLNVGYSAFLNIQSVPEPTVLVFSLAGFAMLAFGRRFYK